MGEGGVVGMGEGGVVGMGEGGVVGMGEGGVVGMEGQIATFIPGFNSKSFMFGCCTDLANIAMMSSCSVYGKNHNEN